MRRALFGRSVASLVSDNRLKKANNLLLPGGHDVELPAHLGEAGVDVCTDVDEVLPKGVETGGGGSAELTDFAAELADVALGGPRLHRSSLPMITDDGITSFRPGQRGSRC
jgi:hypothetical protein